MLTGLNQNGMQSDTPPVSWGYTDIKTAGGQSET